MQDYQIKEKEKEKREKPEKNLETPSNQYTLINSVLRRLPRYAFIETQMTQKTDR